MLTVTDVWTTCAVVIFRVKGSCITSVNDILPYTWQVKHETSISSGESRGIWHAKRGLLKCNPIGHISAPGKGELFESHLFVCLFVCTCKNCCGTCYSFRVQSSRRIQWHMNKKLVYQRPTRPLKQK